MSGEEGLYAAAQAVELALGRDLDVRMQGLVLDDAAATDRYKRRGAYGALLAGFPISVAHQAGRRPVVGVITFGARPCNSNPDDPDGAAQQLFVTRTYLATPSETPRPGYRIRTLGSRTEIGAAQTPLPHTLREEIRRLHDLHDCRHVLLLAHRFGERRLGRRAGGARLLAQGQLLREVAEAFPELVLYPLLRDTFPATRLRRRDRDEDAFEILEPDEHLHAIPDSARPLRQEYTPVYSLATFHVVGESPASRKPQSGFCTYFLLRDTGSAPIEVAERLRANLLLTTSPVRASLVAVLRGIHYVEAERSVTAGRTARPVLDPYDWLTPGAAGKQGEIVVFERSRRRRGSVALSLPAVLDAVSRVLHATPDRATPRVG